MAGTCPDHAAPVAQPHGGAVGVGITGVCGGSTAAHHSPGACRRCTGQHAGGAGGRAGGSAGEVLGRRLCAAAGADERARRLAVCSLDAIGGAGAVGDGPQQLPATSAGAGRAERCQRPPSRPANTGPLACLSRAGRCRPVDHTVRPGPRDRCAAGQSGRPPGTPVDTGNGAAAADTAARRLRPGLGAGDPCRRAGVRPPGTQRGLRSPAGGQRQPAQPTARGGW